MSRQKGSTDIHNREIPGNQNGNEHGYAVDMNCIGCGICAGISPDVFRMDEKGHADAEADPSADLDPVGAAQAMASCPVGAIEKK